jgi:hypothetical protein
MIEKAAKSGKHKHLTNDLEEADRVIQAPILGIFRVQFF